MEKEKAILKTLKKMLELHSHDAMKNSHGLCNWASTLRIYSQITADEYRATNEYIDKNRPKWWQLDTWIYPSSLVSLIFKESYYWNPALIKPRIKWLKKHIKLLTTKIANNDDK